jgi:hypothetical protein
MRSVILLLALVAPSAGAESPLTTAESSGYTATSTYADVMAYVRELQQRRGSSDTAAGHRCAGARVARRAAP